jgi:formate hydrogenlyase transcriptional activator
LKSFCFLPLISRNRAIGTLVLARLRDDVFSQADISFLAQIANQIALAVENAIAYREIRELKEQLSKEKLYLEDELRAEMNFAQIIGNSASLRRVLKRVETVAPTDSTVLIYGETGTGKELVARAIHDLSPRRTKAFVKLNCAAIPTGLLESELFGHEKGDGKILIVQLAILVISSKPRANHGVPVPTGAQAKATRGAKSP